MPAGSMSPSESVQIRDSVSGTGLRCVTAFPAIHHHPFYYLPAYDDAQRMLFFVSHRTGRPEIWAELREKDCALLQLTEHPQLAEWSVHPSWDGKYVYYTDHRGGWRVSTDNFKSDQLVDFGDGGIRMSGMVGAAMGTTALSRDGRYWAVPVRAGKVSKMVIIDTVSGSHVVILERDQIGHPEFHPNDSSLIRYAGPYDSRIWVIHRDGSDNRLVYQRNIAAKQWIVHETWNPSKREILTADWPNGVIGIDIDTGTVRRVTDVNAWHPMVSRNGRWMIADTNFPDIGLQLFEVNPKGKLQSQTVCHPNATSRGDHWNRGHCPYDDDDFRAGTVKVYAPQHTHPHPQFSPDGRFAVFTSDRTGHAQIYEVEIPYPRGECSTARLQEAE